MKTPRNLNGTELAKLLIKKLGYQVTRQKGSHIRLTTQEPSEHHITIPEHVPLKIGTLHAILSDIATHLAIEREELLVILFE